MRVRLPAVLLALALVAAGCGTSGRVDFDTRALASRGEPIEGFSSEEETGELVEGGLLPTGGGPGAAGRTGAQGPGGGGTGPGGGGAASGAVKGTIKLGTVLPLQGGQRSFGEPILRTTQAYIEEVNARGGVNGWRLELIAYNACLLCQAEAQAAVRRLVEQDQVFALVNTYVMVVAFESVIPYLVRHGVPLIQGGSEKQTSDALSPVNFATAPPGAFYGRFIPVMAKRYAKVNRVGITYLDVPAEREGVPILRRELEREGVEVVAEESVDAAEEAVTNMDAIVTRMRSQGAEGVVATNPVLVIYGRLASSRQRWNAQWIGPAAWSQLVEESCGATCDDYVLTDTAGLSYIDRNTPQMQQFLDTMRRRYPGGQITGHTLAAWVGMQVTSEAIVRAGGADRRAFLRALETFRNLDLGTTSPLTFTPDRHMGGSASILLRLKGGRYIRVSEPLNFGETST